MTMSQLQAPAVGPTSPGDPVRESPSVLRVVRSSDGRKLHGEVVGKLARFFHYVREDAPISDVADDLEHLAGNDVIGVVDNEGHAKGILTANELFNILGKRFGRDVWSRKEVGRIARECPVFDCQRNIFSVSEEIAEALRDREDRYYLLTTGEGNFYGVLNTRDLLVYLSAITSSDIAMARTLQGNIVKDTLYLDEPRFRLLGKSCMAKGVGGDFYAVKRLENGKIAVLLCDVSGKGVAASLVTTCISGICDTWDFARGLAGFVGHLNSYLFDTFHLEKFVTGLFLEFDPATGMIEILDAGHSFLYLMDRFGKIFRVKSSGENTPLGIDPGAVYEADHYQMEVGSRLFLLTDGLLEQPDGANEAFGENRFFQIIRMISRQELREAGDAVMQRIRDFRGNQPQQDDISFIFLEFLA